DAPAVTADASARPLLDGGGAVAFSRRPTNRRVAVVPENVGRLVQVLGPVVDAQFAEGNVPPIYQALRVMSDGFKTPRPIDVILEVQQHLGEGRVRCVAMQPTEGMVRGMPS